MREVVLTLVSAANNRIRGGFRSDPGPLGSPSISHGDSSRERRPYVRALLRGRTRLPASVVPAKRSGPDAGAAPLTSETPWLTVPAVVRETKSAPSHHRAETLRLLEGVQ